MSIRIDEEKFTISHEVFSRYMLQQSGGVPFTNFQHPILIDDEIAYKWGVYNTAKHILDLHKWTRWKIKSPGKIVEAVKAACKSNVSENLLEHRYGARNSSGALYKADSPKKIEKLENQLFDFFLGGASDPAEFGPRFDSLANFLRKNCLGCNWAFLAYLAFLSSRQVYFPIRPTRFDALLHYYGVGVSISGYVSWERYKVLLDLGEALKRKLAIYGTPNAIEIQSYMWVISYLIQDESMADQKASTEIDFNSELKGRVRKAKERERIGLLGEKYIYEEERNKLRKANRDDLADKVTLVSINDDSHGFDVLSFTSEGTPLHIEVKTTTRSPVDDNGFWLSENERLEAEQDVYWAVYRVWNVNISPSYQNLGNIVLDKSENWELRASSWYVQHRRAG